MTDELCPRCQAPAARGSQACATCGAPIARQALVPRPARALSPARRAWLAPLSGPAGQAVAVGAAAVGLRLIRALLRRRAEARRMTPARRPPEPSGLVVTQEGVRVEVEEPGRRVTWTAVRVVLKRDR